MQGNNSLIQAINDLISASYKPTEPGVAVIVVKDGKPLLRMGLGMANLELGVPIKPDMVFRLGSITKQFTAVAILMLAEQGKLALEDAITDFLPDYPTHDHLITVKHLLAHTSGIKSYTDMPEWLPLWRKDFTVQELIDFFKSQPMQFAPGERWAYNNSGYVLLGAIIEKVSGQPYEQFIQQDIFDRLGMKHSNYDSPLRVIPGRVSGYDRGTEGYTNADYLSLTQPYAAGALASTVDDLAIWDTALYTDQLLTQETLQQAFVPRQLTDGSSAAYGYGWAISEYAEHVLVEHGGGIHGFRTHAIRIPSDHAFIAVLSNNTGADPGQLAFKIAALVIDRPYQEPSAIELSPEVFARYEGVYKNNALEDRRITCRNNRLYLQRSDSEPLELVALLTNEFYCKINPLNRIRFLIDKNGVVTSAELRARFGPPEICEKVCETAPAPS